MSGYRARSGMRLIGVAVVLAAATPGPLFAGDGFVETFTDDPVAAGRWSIVPGENVSRFTYNAGAGTIAAAYDTGLPTARLIRPLGRTLDENDSFICTVTFTIRSSGFFASTYADAEISFGFLNTATTGPDRAGFSADPKAFDVVTFDYFPNVTFYGGPSLVPTIIQTDAGQGFFSAIDFVSGSETELTDAGEGHLPLDTPLNAVVRYRGDTQRATLRVLQGGTPIMINAGGGLDGDSTTVTTPLTDVGFEVDAFGLLCWKDTWTNASIVMATLDFDAVEVLAPAFGDFDRDADVDGDDWMTFEQCQSGPGIAAASECLMCDSDADGDVDATDFGAYQREVTGSR